VYTDESGHQRRTFTNALGSIIEVDEPDAAGHLTVQTCSTYDLLGNLTAVSHTYAVSGNACSGDPSAPCTRKDARNITTTYTYNDNLNRLTSKTYSDSTPPVTFSYDQTSVTIGSWSSGTLLNPEGRLTKATTTSGGNVQTAVVYSYDPVGRIKDFWQCNPSNCANVYNTHYNYDLAGDVTSWVHPGVFTLTNTVSVAQRVTNVQSSLTGANFPQTLAQNITYTPWGAVSQLQNGCVGDGCTMVQETYDYNNRLQPVRIQLGTATNNSANHCLVYNYYSDVGNPSSCAAPSQGTANNGNVMGYWYQDNVQPWTHTASYTYDNLNRLATAWATGNATYNLTFGYDRYGNMTCVTNGQTNGPCPNLTFSLGTNRLTTSGFTYDAAGNLTNDCSTMPAHTYQWDAEGRVSYVDPANNPPTWSFTYNAVGDRVQWVHPGGTDQHIFDPAGNSLGVYGAWDLIWLGDRLSVVYTGSETYFNHINHLSSTTAMSNHLGTGVEDMGFYPWGGVWQQWGSGGYSFADMPYYDTNTSTSPTMYRFYSMNVGRWHSPDPLGGDITNPQSLNLYPYALNNPTNFTDPNGDILPMPGCDPWGIPLASLATPGLTHMAAGVVRFPHRHREVAAGAAAEAAQEAAGVGRQAAQPTRRALTCLV
jgi:RHS repeat-associated protein